MTIAKVPAPTPRMTQSLAPQELDGHRAKIGMEVQIVLSGYWQAQTDADREAAILADWMDELEEWTPDQVREGLRKWRRANPSKRPNPGHIARLLKDQRGRAYADGDTASIFSPANDQLRIAAQ